METIQQQIGALQLIVQKQQAGMKRQRFAIIALAGIIVAGGFIAAVRPVGDAAFDTITCKHLQVIDNNGTVRFAAFTTKEGEPDPNIQKLINEGREGYADQLRGRSLGINAYFIVAGHKGSYVESASYANGNFSLGGREVKP